MTKTTKKRGPKKPVLIQCGKHFINPADVRAITKVRNKLYVIKFFSEPNPEWPCWVEEKHIGKLLEHFEIITTDDETLDISKFEE